MFSLSACAQVQPFSMDKTLQVDGAEIHRMTVDSDLLQSLSTARHTELELHIPMANKGIRKLILTKTNALAPDVVLYERHYSGQTVIPQPDILHYQGKVLEAKSSIVSISIYKNEMLGMISFDQQNWNLQKEKQSEKYLLYNDDKISVPSISFCESAESIEEMNVNTQYVEDDEKSLKAMSSVDVYIECDYQMFTDHGSNVSNTLSYTTSLLNTVNLIFNMSNINLNITQIDVWTTPDPYDANAADSSKDVLNSFKCELDGAYNGRIAHLLSTTHHFGGIANRRDYCPYEEPLYGFSRIFTSFNSDLNLYSWSVNVVAHEIGHNLSSPHTHNCSWNGNNTQIDDCANVYSTSNNNDSDCDGVIDNIEEASGSDCFDILNPIIPSKGTIMSYCHISSSGNGVDLSLGFHPQVGHKMKSYIDNCLSPSTVMYCPMPQLADIQISTTGSNEMILTCNVTNGIDGYSWYIKPDIPCTADTTITTLSPTLSYTYAHSGVPYIVKCILNCDSGPEWGEWSCEKEFTTPCDQVLDLTGSVANLTKTEAASDYIHSQESIHDAADIVYQIGNEATLLEGFEIEIASVFEIVLNVCH